MSKVILVVDDSSSIRQVTKIVLSAEGYQVIDASDGCDALSKLDGAKIHLIISDLNMPNMDGLTLLGHVKQLPAYRFTPFVMLTTESGQDFIDRGKLGGAKAWMIKPFNPESLTATVAKLLA